MAHRGSSPESLDLERRASAAESADNALTRYLEQPGQNAPRPIGLTRRIALIALFFHLRQGSSIQASLDAAAGLHEGRPGLSGSYLRKSKSEARAVIGALISSPTLPDAKLKPNTFFARLDALLDAISFDQVNRSRAHALRGTRGGRRSRNHPQLVLQGLILLKRRLDEGDASAIDELAAIRQLLNEWDVSDQAVSQGAEHC